MRENPRPQEIYRHFKGNLYQILSLAEHTETGKTLVVYQALYGEFKVYARELSMFLDETDKEKYPSAVQKYRFEKVRLTADKVSEESTQKERAQKESTQKENTQKESIQIESIHNEQTIDGVDPLVMEFLDADSYEERLNILAAMQGRITDEMINTMAVSVDLEINEGSVEERYDALKNCLLMLEKYECNRLR